MRALIPLVVLALSICAAAGCRPEIVELSPRDGAPDREVAGPTDRDGAPTMEASCEVERFVVEGTLTCRYCFAAAGELLEKVCRPTALDGGADDSLHCEAEETQTATCRVCYHLDRSEAGRTCEPKRLACIPARPLAPAARCDTCRIEEGPSGCSVCYDDRGTVLWDCCRGDLRCPRDAGP